MTLGKVIGSLVSTMKHECYQDKKILLVRPINPDGKTKSGTIVAVDTVDAGSGDIVLVASEGQTATEVLGFSTKKPLRSIIIGVVDRIDHHTNE